MHTITFLSNSAVPWYSYPDKIFPTALILYHIRCHSSSADNGVMQAGKPAFQPCSRILSFSGLEQKTCICSTLVSDGVSPLTILVSMLKTLTLIDHGLDAEPYQNMGYRRKYGRMKRVHVPDGPSNLCQLALPQPPT